MGQACDHTTVRRSSMSARQSRSRITQPGYHKGRPAPNKGKTYPPTRLEPEQVAALIEAAGTERRGIRNRAIIAMLYRTGIEIAEALQLKLDSDIDLTPGRESIRAYGSGRLTPRTLALDAVALALLQPWLEVRAELERSGEYLFCTIERGRGKATRCTTPMFGSGCATLERGRSAFAYTHRPSDTRWRLNCSLRDGHCPTYRLSLAFSRSSRSRISTATWIFGSRPPRRSWRSSVPARLG
jgi:integrase